MKDIAIKFENVSFAYDREVILENLNLVILEGESVSILGPSGSGKSTILKLIAGLIKPDRGRIFVLGRDITSIEEAEMNTLRRSIGLVFQGGALFDSMTVAENVGYRFYEEGKLSEEEIRAIVREKLAFVGLEDAIDMVPAQLSGGMKKRVAIARALACNPSIMLYDEPTTGLDPLTAKMIAKHILDLQRHNRMTSIIVTHDIYYSFLLTNRIIMIHRGEKIFDGSKEEIRKSENPYIKEYLSGEAI